VKPLPITNFGSASEFWMAGVRNSEIDGPPVLFATEHSARSWARENVSRIKECSVYRCELVGHMVLDEPRWKDLRPADNGDER
jgi:hypothetical protein